MHTPQTKNISESFAKDEFSEEVGKEAVLERLLGAESYEVRYPVAQINPLNSSSCKSRESPEPLEA